jgi:hypothetical protein
VPPWPRSLASPCSQLGKGPWPSSC